MDADGKIVADAVTKLSEHFDSVRIFVTRRDGAAEETVSISKGTGNFYAQLGQVREWTLREDQTARESVKTKNES